jgi:hypothetical protein
VSRAAINAEKPHEQRHHEQDQSGRADVPTTVARLPAVLSAKTNPYEPYVAESGPPHRAARKGTVRRTCVA